VIGERGQDCCQTLGSSRTLNRHFALPRIQHQLFFAIPDVIILALDRISKKVAEDYA